MNISINKRFLLLYSLCVVALTGCQNFGKEVDFGDINLFYKEGATKENAEKLGEYLVKSNFWQDHDGKFVVQLLKNGELYQVNFPVKDSFAHDWKYVAKVSAFASVLSDQVFNNAKVEIHLCDTRMNTKSVVGMNHQTEMKTYQHNNYSIKYPIDWTLNIQKKEFEFALQSPIVYNYVNYNMITLKIVDLAPLHVTSIGQLLQMLAAEATTTSDGSPRQIIQKTTGNKNGLDFAKIVYIMVEDSASIRVTGLIYKVGDMGYMLSAYAGQETLNKYGYENTETAIFNSFEVKQ
ncbi:MAG: hypothetical protein P4L41_19050 [Flavipsychrobacter sp.]|nr:hypothetical protein [Flavipsychrobacter sp.]